MVNKHKMFGHVRDAGLRNGSAKTPPICVSTGAQIQITNNLIPPAYKGEVHDE